MAHTAYRMTPSQLRVAICDDNPTDREKYSRLLKEIARNHDLQVEIVTFESASSTLFEMTDPEIPVDILFMDIAMPQEDGLSVSRKLRRKDGPVAFTGELIFLTSSTEHAVDGYDVHAFHYVVKGATPIERFEQIFVSAAHAAEERRKKRLLLRGIGEYRSVDVDSITYFEIQHRIVTVHYGDPEECFEFYCPMNRLEEIVMPFGLIRIHNSFIVNLKWVEKLTRIELTMSSGASLPVSKGKYTLLRQILDKIEERSDR